MWVCEALESGVRRLMEGGGWGGKEGGRESGARFLVLGSWVESEVVGGLFVWRLGGR